MTNFNFNNCAINTNLTILMKIKGFKDFSCSAGFPHKIQNQAQNGRFEPGYWAKRKGLPKQALPELFTIIFLLLGKRTFQSAARSEHRQAVNTGRVLTHIQLEVSGITHH